MTGPDTTAPDPAAAPLPGAGRETLTAPAPPTDTGRGRRRWVIGGLAALTLAGLAAGLVAWAPWVPPPVLRPAGLAAGAATATSVTISWSRPPTGPLPDKYLILSNGRLAGSAAGTATSWRQAGLTPASAYHDRVIAVRGGKHSPASAALTLKTLTPPLSQARLQGPWTVSTAHVHGVNLTLHTPDGLSWTFTPVCRAGACNVVLHQLQNSLTVKLTRTGTVYHGAALDYSSPCQSGATSVPDPIAIAIRIRITAATGQNHMWAASSWQGVMAGVAQDVSGGTFYCSAGHFTAVISSYN